MLSPKMTYRALIFIILVQFSICTKTNFDELCSQPGADFVRDPEDCTIFCRCFNGQATDPIKCPRGLYFNTAINVCDWPSNLRPDDRLECEELEKRKRRDNVKNTQTILEPKSAVEQESVPQSSPYNQPKSKPMKVLSVKKIKKDDSKIKKKKYRILTISQTSDTSDNANKPSSSTGAPEEVLNNDSLNKLETGNASTDRNQPPSKKAAGALKKKETQDASTVDIQPKSTKSAGDLKKKETQDAVTVDIQPKSTKSAGALKKKETQDASTVDIQPKSSRTTPAEVANTDSIANSELSGTPNTSQNPLSLSNSEAQIVPPQKQFESDSSTISQNSSKPRKTSPQTSSKNIPSQKLSKSSTSQSKTVQIIPVHMRPLPDFITVVQRLSNKKDQFIQSQPNKFTDSQGLSKSDTQLLSPQNKPQPRTLTNQPSLAKSVAQPAKVQKQQQQSRLFSVQADSSQINRH